jgi:hypothetical protein
MIIVIGDAAPNTVEEVEYKRNYAAKKLKNDWKIIPETEKLKCASRKKQKKEVATNKVKLKAL